MKLITGEYDRVKLACRGLFPSGFFDFKFLYVPESVTLFCELDRFLSESKRTLRFVNEYTGNVAVDISDWNHKPLNRYFEAFMYYLKDNTEKYDCALIIDERCSSEMLEELERIFGEVKEIKMPAVNEVKKAKIGFLSSDIMEVNNNVRS